MSRHADLFVSVIHNRMHKYMYPCAHVYVHEFVSVPEHIYIYTVGICVET